MTERRLPADDLNYIFISMPELQGCDRARMQLICLLFFSQSLFAGFELSIEPGIGYKTDVPSYNGTDSLPLYENRLLGSLSVEPSWTRSTNNGALWSIASAVWVDHYIMDGPAEISLEPEATATWESESRSTSAGFGVSYYSLPAGNDPSVPWNCWEFSPLFSRTYKWKHPLTFSNTFSIVYNVADSRFELKAAGKIKELLRITPRISTSGTIGGEIVSSMSVDTWYWRPLLGCGGTFVFNEMNMAFLQIRASRPFHRTESVSGTVLKYKNNPKHPPDTVIENFTHVVQPRIWNVTASASYCRTLSDAVDLFFNYDFTILDPGEPEPLYRSHTAGISLEWRIK